LDVRKALLDRPVRAVARAVVDADRLDALERRERGERVFAAVPVQDDRDEPHRLLLDEMRDRAGARLALPAAVPLDLRDEPRDTRVDVAVPAGVDCIVEEQVPAGPDESSPALEVGLRTLVAVVAVDEEQLELARRRLDRARVRDDEVHLAREPVA